MTQSAACASDACFAPSRSTGKERDTESGNDYFGARYYASSMGRFLSPDWSAQATPVPYAAMGDPQSLNLYGYMRNNPLGGTDPDGHCDIGCQIGIVMGIVNGIQRDGGVGPYSRNVGIGAAKGVGQAGYFVGSALGAGFSGNPYSLGMSMLNQPAAITPSNVTQAQAALVTSTLTMTVVGSAPAAIETATANLAVEIPEVMTEGMIFRSVGTNPGNLTGEDLSFRTSLSNPIDSSGQPAGGNVVFQPGKPAFGVDVSKLPQGSAVLDNTPPGHVTVNAAPEAIKDAVDPTTKIKFPKE